MLIEIKRFMTTEQVRVESCIPDELAPTILPILPVVGERQDGTRIHHEGEVDAFLTEYFRGLHMPEVRHNPAPKGEPGRKTETLEIAEYANQLKSEGKTWKQIFSACKQRWPGDPRVDNREQVRATWQRHFKRKKKAN